MLLTNHTMTGLVLSRLIPEPIILAPVALASHLAIDSIPHFGAWPYASKQWKLQATIDNLVALTLFVGVLVAQPDKWVQTVVGVFFACLPDLIFLPEIFLRQGRRFNNFFSRFHSWVQHESVGAGLIELTYGVGIALILKQLIQ